MNPPPGSPLSCGGGIHISQPGDFLLRSLVLFQNSGTFRIQKVAGPRQFWRFAAGVSLRSTNSWTTLLTSRSAVLIANPPNTNPGPRFESG